LTLDHGQGFRLSLVLEENVMESIGIGALAKAAGVGIDTVCYYERAGLVAPSDRLASGCRRYSRVEVSRLRFIRRAQAPGFSLREIRELLALSSSRNVASGRRKAEAKRMREGLGGELQ
jgi:DNA-binding transcriptional MerR regulator